MVANRTREIRLSGMKRGAWGLRLVEPTPRRETWPMVEMCTHLATERAGVVTLHLREGAPQLYPDPLQWIDVGQVLSCVS